MVNVSRALRVIQEFRKHDPELQTQACQAFLQIAGQEGISIQELARLISTAGATASRNVALLGPRHRSGRAGLGLIEARTDPADNRVRRLYLTSRGRVLAETFRAITGE